MKRLLPIFLVLAVYLTSTAQSSPYKFDLGGGMGMSGYIGEAASTPFKKPGFTAHAGMRFFPDVRWAFRGVLGVTTLSGDTKDMNNVIPDFSDVTFSTTVFSVDAKAEFNFLPYGIGETYKKLSRWSPYLTVGVGACIASSGGNAPFALTLPMGFGVKYKLKPRLNLDAEFSMTKVFSDKVDGDKLNDLTGIKTAFYKNTDWVSKISVGITYEFGERCETCHYKD